MDLSQISVLLFRYSRTLLNLSAFVITETELKLMAAAAIIGFRST